MGFTHEPSVVWSVLWLKHERIWTGGIDPLLNDKSYGLFQYNSHHWLVQARAQNEEERPCLGIVFENMLLLLFKKNLKYIRHFQKAIIILSYFINEYLY